MVCRSMHAASFAKPLKTILPTPLPWHCRFVAWAGPLRVSGANLSKPHTARNPFLYHMRFPSWVSAGCLNTKLKLHAKCDLRGDLEPTATHVRRTVKTKHSEPKWIRINKCILSEHLLVNLGFWIFEAEPTRATISSVTARPSGLEQQFERPKKPFRAPSCGRTRKVHTQFDAFHITRSYRYVCYRVCSTNSSRETPCKLYNEEMEHSPKKFHQTQ